MHMYTTVYSLSKLIYTQNFIHRKSVAKKNKKNIDHTGYRTVKTAP